MVAMPFGKFKGMPVDELPDDYLLWLDSLNNLRPFLRRAVDEEIERRRSEEDFDDETVCRGDAVLNAWRNNWRRIIFLAHPDRGGNEELAKLLIAINEIVEERSAWPTKPSH
jgi:hypothetical protein